MVYQFWLFACEWDRRLPLTHKINLCRQCRSVWPFTTLTTCKQFFSIEAFRTAGSQIERVLVVRSRFDGPSTHRVSHPPVVDAIKLHLSLPSCMWYARYLLN